MRFSSPITSRRPALIRYVVSYGFSRKLLTGPYGSYDEAPNLTRSLRSFVRYYLKTRIKVITLKWNLR